MTSGEPQRPSPTLSGTEYPELLAYRNEFPLVQRKTYLNTCSIGPLSNRSLHGMSQFMMWNEWHVWLNAIDKARQKFATLIGAQLHEVAIASSVSAALSSIATAIDYSTRNKVIMCDMDFPTLPYQWLAKERLNIECRIIKSPDRIGVPPELFASEVDSKTALVATSRVFYLSGYVQDIASIADIAHKHGAYLLVDDYQGTGQVPINVKDLNIDFLVTGALKWLVGGPGLAFVYIREDLIPSLKPTIAGWFGSSEQFQFHTHEFVFRPDATRIGMGTPAMAAVYAANGGLDIILEAGIEHIWERTRYLTEDLLTRAHAHNWKVRATAHPEQRSAIVILEEAQPQQIVQELMARDIMIDSYPGVLRISPYFYNTIEENALVIDTISEIKERNKKNC